MYSAEALLRQGEGPRQENLHSVLTVGSTLQGRYRIESVLGQGGMGTVYLARQTLLNDKPVAIKETNFTSSSPQEREQIAQQFRFEASMLASLSHPGLVRVLDFLQEGDAGYLIMDFVHGRTLEAVLNDTPGDIEPQQAVKWMEEVCDVLIYLHLQKPPVIFRDLKPSNIMLEDSGDIRVIDFGIAKTAGADSRTRTLIRAVGTPGYSPLEQFAGSTDARSDIYALGATLYTLLTSTIPPSSVDIGAQEAELISPDELNPRIPEVLAMVVMKMMAMHKEDRYATAALTKEALRQAMSGDADGALRKFMVEEKAREALPEYERLEVKRAQTLQTLRHDDVVLEAPPPSAAVEEEPAPPVPAWVEDTEEVPHVPALYRSIGSQLRAAGIETDPFPSAKPQEEDRTVLVVAAVCMSLLALPYIGLARPEGPAHWINMLCYALGRQIGATMAAQLQLPEALAVLAGAFVQLALPVMAVSIMLARRSHFWVFGAFLWAWLNIVEIGTYLRDVRHGNLVDAVAQDWKLLLTTYNLQDWGALQALEMHFVGQIGIILTVLLMVREITLRQKRQD